MAGFGDTLRQARAHKGVTLKEAEQATRINRHHLAALEDENFGALPPLIYQRGIIRNYAVYLDLDPSKLLAMFESAHGAVVSPSKAGVGAVPPIDMPSHWAPNFAIIAFSVVLSAIVFAWVYSAYVAPPETLSTASPPVPTVTPIDTDVPLPTDPPATPAPATAEPTDEPENTPEPTEEPEPTDEPTEEPTERSDESDTGTEDDNADAQSGGDNRRAPDADADAEDGEEDPSGEDSENAVAAILEQNSRAADEAGDNGSDEADQAEGAEDDTASGEFVTGITVVAEEEIYVTVTVDGDVEFDGVLPAGESTEQFVGSSFEVYTSSGDATEFINACGLEFTMGDEQGEATYQLDANPDSCAP